MPHASTKQFHIHDFTFDEVAAWVASLNLSPDAAIVAPAEGRMREVAQQRVHAKVRAAKAGAKDKNPVLPPSDSLAGLQVSWPITQKMLDDWLSALIPDLPAISKYDVFQPPRLPDVALRVRWEASA